MKFFIPYLAKKWNFLAGNYNDFEPANRAYNAVSVITLLILIILLPFNIVIGLYPVAYLMLTMILLQSVLYYLARWKKKYVTGFVVYVVASYITLIINFFFNAGTIGPTFYLFFLTFQLLIAFSPRKQHPLWALLHLVIPVVLLLIELYYPKWIKGHYASDVDRLTDLSSSYIVILICMYGITIYLRNNYNRERETAQRRAEEITTQNNKLAALDAEKNKLFSIISHDLKGPLGTIIASLEVLTEYELEEQDRKKMKLDLLDLSRNTSDMLVNLLYWSSARIKGVQLNIVKVNMQRVLEKVLSVQGIIAAAKSIDVNTRISSGLFAKADSNILELILRNLVQNAVKFTPVNGKITITAQPFENGCLCTISDTGVGISDDKLQTLFTLQSGGVTYGTNNEKGTGLGLILCNEFAGLMDGRLWAKSIPGEGSDFYLYLPTDTAYNELSMAG